MKMKSYSITDSGIVLQVKIADTFLTRLCGLMLQRPLPPATALLIAPCNSIHMCFMRFAIDAVYFDGEGRVVKIVPHLAPWLGLSACLRAKGCLEMKAGEANRLGIQVGMVRAGK